MTYTPSTLSPFLFTFLILKKAVSHAFIICISMIINEVKYLFMFIGHFHVLFYKLPYPLPDFFFYLFIIGYRSYLYIMNNIWLYMWQIFFTEKF